jgi:hypothetical protein
MTINGRWCWRGASIAALNCDLKNYGITMEVNQLKRQLKDLGERIASLRGFL